MSFVRARALRGLQNGLRSSGLRPALRGNTLKHAQLQAKRYASSEGGHEASSDLPWLISALVITPVASWFLWPSSHADHHEAHGDHDEHGEDESHDSEEKEEDAPEDDSAAQDEESPKEGAEDDAPKGDDKDDKEDAPKDDSQPANEGAEQQDGKAEDSSDSNDTPEKGKSSALGKGKLQADSAGASDTRKSEPDGKGGYKKRIDSGLQKDLAQGPTVDGQDTDPEKRNFNTTAGKQQGMSNTQTRHSIPIHKDPEKSKKADGTPETAKTMGTVDPSQGR